MARKLEFKTEKELRKLRTRRIIVGFIAFVAVFSVVSVFVLLRYYDFDLGNIFDGRVEETSEGETTSVDLSPLSGEANILLCCTDSGAEKLYFVSVVRADLDARRLFVCPLSPEAEALGAGAKATLNAHLAVGGMPRLIDAVQNLTGVKISRYVSGDESGFRDAVNEAGGLTVTVNERIEYRSDALFLILPTGKQTLRGDMALKYLRYCLTKGEEGLPEQGAILCSLLDGAVTQANLDDGDELYRSLVNLLDTDISIIDFTNAKPLISLLISSGEMLPSNTVASLTD